MARAITNCLRQCLLSLVLCISLTPTPNLSGLLQLGPKRKKRLATPLKMAGPTLLFFRFWFEHLISGPKITRTFEKCTPVSNKWKWNKYPRDIVAFLLLTESKYFQFGAGAIGRDRTVTLSRNTMKWLRGGLANAHTHTHRKKTKQKQGFLALFQRGELVQFPVQSGFFLVISCTIRGNCIRNSCSVASIWDKIQANQHSPKINTVASSLLSFPRRVSLIQAPHSVENKYISWYSRISRKRPPKMQRISGRWREMVAHGGSTAGLNLGDKHFSVTSSSPAFKVKSCKFCNTRQHLRTRKIVSKINKKQNAKQNDRGVQNNDIACIVSASAQVCSTFSTQKRLLHRLRTRNP